MLAIRPNQQILWCVKRTLQEHQNSYNTGLMQIIIGIFQDKEDVTKFIKRRMLDMTSLTEVGPFFSKNQALLWMDELHSRIDNSEIAFIPEITAKELQWYGFTFEE